MKAEETIDHRPWTIDSAVCRQPLRAAVLVAAVLLLLGGRAGAADTVEAWLTITNVPVHEAKITFDGVDQRMWSTTVTNSALQIHVTNTIAWARSNLYLHLVGNEPDSVNAIQYSTNDTLYFEGYPDEALSITTVSNWATVTYRTNTSSRSITVTVPVGNEPLTVQTQIVSGVVDILNNTNLTNKVSAAAAAMEDFLGADTQSQVSSNKSFVNGVWSGGVSNANVFGSFSLESNVWLTVPDHSYVGISNRSGGVFLFTEALSANRVLKYGEYQTLTPIPLPAQFGQSNYDGNTYFHITNGAWLSSPYISSEVYGQPTFLTGLFWVSNATLYMPPDSAFYSWDETISYNMFGYSDGRTVDSIMQLGDMNTGQFGYQTDAAGSVSIKSGAKLTNIVVRGPWTNAGAMILSNAPIETAVPGNNILTRPAEGNVLVISDSGGEVTVCAITNHFGDGDWLWVLNQTGYDMTFANSSGFTSIDTIRLRTVNLVSNVTVRSWGYALLVYHAFKWNVVYPEIAYAASTNVTLFIETNGVAVGARSNVNLIVGSGITLLATNNGDSNRVDIEISASGGGISGTNVTLGNVTALATGAVNVALSVIPATGTASNSFQVLGTNGVEVRFAVGSNDVLFGGSVLPTTNVAYDLGSATFYWRTGYVGSGVFSNVVIRGLTNSVGLTVSSPVGNTNDVAIIPGTNGGGGVLVKANGEVRLGTNVYAGLNGGITFSNSATADQNFLSQNGSVFLRSGYSGTKVFSSLPIESIQNFAINNDTFIYRTGAGTNGIGGPNSSSTPTGTLNASNYIVRGVVHFPSNTFSACPVTAAQMGVGGFVDWNSNGYGRWVSWTTDGSTIQNKILAP